VTQFSYSRVSLFQDCPYHFDLRYNQGLTEISNLNADNPLIIGHALHTGIEHDVETALNEYYNSFPVLTNAIVEEAMKLEILIPKVKAFLEKNFEGFEFIHEYKIDHERYLGFVDLIAKAPDDTYMVVDFKYSNNIENYLKSGQLHIYKDYLELDGFDVQRLAYLFVPKTSIKQKKDEDLFQFRKRLVKTVEASEVKFVPIEFDQMESIYFKNTTYQIEKTKDFSKRNMSGKCFSCNPKFRPNYLEAIEDEKGEIVMALPKNERREKKIDTKPDFWLYADSYVGKSTFVDQFPNVLFLNTDGNTDNTTAPVIRIKDEVTKTGRVTNRKLAWEVFLDAIQDLETEENDFEAVALDLVEDLRDHCRVYVFDKNGWEHESDGGFGKGWDKVKLEFNNAIKRLKALGYQVIYISKEIKDEVTLKGGGKRSTFKPNVDDKTANFLTGTVDLTLRAYVNSDDERFLQLKKQQNVFGGGRYDWKVDTIPLEYEAFIEELTAAQEGKETRQKSKPAEAKAADPKEEKPKRERKSRKDKEEAAEEVFSEDTYFYHAESDSYFMCKKGEVIPTDADFQISAEISKEEYEKGVASQIETSAEEEKPKRQRRSRATAEETDAEKEEEKPKRQRRERKAVDETPPGEEAASSEEEEKPARTRRTRKARD